MTGLVVVLALAAPAAAQSRREMQMMADIRMLQEQTQQLQQQLASAIDQLSATLKTISARVDDQAGATRKSFADQKLAVDQFGNDLRIVRERIDENTVRITSLSQEVEALRLAIPQFPATPPAPVDPSAPVVPGAPPDAAAARSAPRDHLGEARRQPRVRPTRRCAKPRNQGSHVPGGDAVPPDRRSAR